MRRSICCIDFNGQFVFSFLSTWLVWSVLTAQSWSQVDDQSPRMTPLVKMIQQIEPSVAALFSANGNQIMSGSGMVIHRDGYILTNHHVLPRSDGVALLGKRPIPFRVVARLPESDIAIVKLNEVPSDLKPLPLGRSADLMNGESVVVAGNPGGRGIVFTSGIVSAKDVLEGGPNALVMTNYENSRRDRFIQFDAASNRGNSGGPLVNMEGQVIGIVAATVLEEQNSGLAIPIDRVRNQFERLFESETIHRRQVGLSLDPFASSATVATVVANSPAATAGVEVGDQIAELDGQKLTSSMDWIMRIDQRLAQGKDLPLRLLRKGRPLTVEIKSQAFVALEPVVLEKTETGLKVSMYEGKFNALPNFSELKPVRESVCSDLKELQEVYRDRQDYFAMVMEGYLRVDDEGLYRLVIVSDDGSKLRLGDQWLIDNDGNHPPKPAGRLARLKKGFYPLRLEYFQGNGDKQVHIYYETVDSQSTMGLQALKELEPQRLVHAKP